MDYFDTVIVGAGAAGLFCAGVAGQLGLKVLLVDHSSKVAEKIRISGGGRCNFTNRDTTSSQFISENQNFSRSALARFTPKDFINLIEKHKINFHEKHKGQLFCNNSANDIIQMLLNECDTGGVVRWHGCGIQAVRNKNGGKQHYEIDTANGTVACSALVVATGGLSIPKIGATDWGYRIAREYKLPIIEPRPALVPLTFDTHAWSSFCQLSGLSLSVELSIGGKKNKMSFTEDLLFTHRGLSGPGVLQISSYWQQGMPIRINLSPNEALSSALSRSKLNSRRKIVNELSNWIPSRLAETWIEQGLKMGFEWDKPISDASDKALHALGEQLSRWELKPTGTEGFRKAEVTAGGVATQALSSQTMESSQPGLYFIGEVVDVTGWLGGYNFQWAWASAHACAQAMAARLANSES